MGWMTYLGFGDVGGVGGGEGGDESEESGEEDDLVMCSEMKKNGRLR